MDEKWSVPLEDAPAIETAEETPERLATDPPRPPVATSDGRAADKLS